MKRLTSILVFLAFIGLSAFAQDIQITGKVTNADDGSTLPGVSVLVKGTDVGAMTNIDGVYSLKAPANATLVFSYVGMITQDVPVNSATSIDVAMAADVTGLEEVVVIAYGTKTKEALTGSVGIVNNENLENVPMTSVDKILKGYSPGVFSASASGQPGSSAAVRIRGRGSISGGNSPLYVIDGIPVEGGTLTRNQIADGGRTNPSGHELSTAMASINPNDIESVTILKDAIATSLYGTRASNGVILITTKKGKEGETKFNFSAQYGFSSLSTNNMEVCNSTEFVELQREGLYNQLLISGYSELEAASLATINAGADTINTKWMDLAFGNNAPTQGYELSASGGTEKTKFFVSGGYFDQTGISLGSYFKRYSGRINIEHAARKNVTFGLNMGTSLAKQGTPLTSAAYYISPVLGAYMYRPNVPAYNPDGTPYFDLDGPAGGASFIGVEKYNDNYSNSLKLTGNLFAEYKFLKNFSYRINLGGDYNDVKEYSWDDPRNPGNTAEGKGRATRNYTDFFIGTITNLLNYTQSFGKSNLGLMLGHEAQSGKYEALDVSVLNFPSATLRQLESGSEYEDSWGTAREYALLSYFARAEYDYNSKYYFSSSFRIDGSSRFGANKRFAPFYAVAGSWRINKESFMDNVSFVDNLKLRTSYGTTGNQEIYYTSTGEPAYYAYQPLYGYGYNYNGNPGSAPEQVGNQDLKWEQKNKFNVGIEYGLFNRINGTIDFYHEKTTDLLMFVPLSLTSGISYALQNVGSMLNKGIEAQISADIVKTDFLWNVDINITSNKNKVLKLNEGEDIVDGTKIRREGEAFETFYMARWAGVNPATGAPMWYDENMNVVEDYTMADKVIVGTADPKFYGGFTNSFGYKGLTLSVMFYYQYGNKIYNSVSRISESDGAFSGWNQDRKQLDRWQQPGDVSPNPRRINGNSSQSNQMSTRWLEDGSYLRLKNITLSYNIPGPLIQKAKIASLRIYVMGTNLWTKTNYSGLDPEQALNGTSWFVYPNSRTITFGLDLGF
jgi:TonB-dependent starch-binding outer membrane protein SusC